MGQAQWKNVSARRLAGEPGRAGGERQTLSWRCSSALTAQSMLLASGRASFPSTESHSTYSSIRAAHSSSLATACWLSSRETAFWQACAGSVRPSLSACACTSGT
eukprot:scaffold34989_cov118-Isochrysis_galbana.AAC.5